MKISQANDASNSKTSTADSPAVNRQSWAVVGSGMLGLTIAHRLRQQGHQVTIFESANRPGGLADAWQVGNVTWDRHYHVTLMSDFLVRDLWEELGIEDRMKWVETKTGFYTDGELYSMSNSVEFLKFPPLGLIDKFRLGATIWTASKIKNWKRLEQTPVQDWLTRLSGKRTFEKMWRPLLEAKLGESWKKTSAAFIWATIARMYAARRSGLKKEMFGYLQGSYDFALKTFEQNLHDRDVRVHYHCPVTEIERSSNGTVMVTAGNERHAFDQVVTTVPSPMAVKSIPEMSAEFRQRHLGVDYHGIVCASVLLKKPISEYYVTNITDRGIPFTAVIEMTALVDPEQLQGQHLVYLPRYVQPDDEIFGESDDSIQERFVSALERMYDHFSRDDVVAFRVSRARHVFALPTLGYSERVPQIETGVDGVYTVNSTQIVNGTLNVNETVKLGNEFVEQYGNRVVSKRVLDSTQTSPADPVLV